MVRVNEFGQPTGLPLPEWETSIDAIRAGSDCNYGTSGDDYIDLAHAYGGENAYSYVFSGQWGFLDYALANESLMPSVMGTKVWHINPNEPDILDYDESFRSQTQIDIYEGDNAYCSRSDHCRPRSCQPSGRQGNCCSGTISVVADENAINVLVEADRQLAQIDLIAAISKGGDASKISEAEAAMAEAMKLTAFGLHNQAVNGYEAAWRAASES